MRFFWASWISHQIWGLSAIFPQIFFSSLNCPPLSGTPVKWILEFLVLSYSFGDFGVSVCVNILLTVLILMNYCKNCTENFHTCLVSLIINMFIRDICLFTLFIEWVWKQHHLHKMSTLAIKARFLILFSPERNQKSLDKWLIAGNIQDEVGATFSAEKSSKNQNKTQNHFCHKGAMSKRYRVN